jgi:hypothetical protein
MKVKTRRRQRGNPGEGERQLEEEAEGLLALPLVSWPGSAMKIPPGDLHPIGVRAGPQQFSFCQK